MAFKIPVTDRVSTFPGRVTLTPVTGKENTFDMKRADEPVEVGTPINKALFDNKAYTLTQDVTVYVDAASGSDERGDGSAWSPFATIQAAVDALPKFLGGFQADISIADGIYPERVVIDSFQGGQLTLGQAEQTVTARGISVIASNTVRLNIDRLQADRYDPTPLLYVGSGSNVLLPSPLSIGGASQSPVGICVEENSALAAIDAPIEIEYCTHAAIQALSGSRVTLGEVSGNVGSVGFRVSDGAVLTYGTNTMVTTTAMMASGGGQIYSGAQSNLPLY